jgi:bisphosphoglycerate-independent phosphoglycerate mutase (AlkP superfamily)
VRDAVYDAISEMDHLAADLREVSMEHGVRIAKAANVDGRYVHMAHMTRACSKMDAVAEKLQNVANTLKKAFFEEPPLHEVREEHLS